MNKYLKNKRSHFIVLMFICMLAIWSGCKVENISPVQESVKDISGSWKVLKATRNGSDITSAVDFTQFRVNFDAAGNYTLVNRLPFIVSGNGKYLFDDPNYPFKVFFNVTGGTTLSTAFSYPIINGVRQINITFSPGCTLNTYVYTLVKSN